MEFKKTQKNYKVTRTSILTSKEVATTNIMAVSEEAVKKQIQAKWDDPYAARSESATRDIISVTDSYEIKEVK